MTGFTELYCYSRWDETTCTYEWFCRDCIATVAWMILLVLMTGFVRLYCNSIWDEITFTYDWFITVVL